MNNKEHLTLDGLQKILCIKVFLNLGLSDEIKINFPNISPIKRPLIVDQKIIDPNWLSGFSSGEGCFHVRFKKSTASKFGVQVSLLFKISLLLRHLAPHPSLRKGAEPGGRNERDKELMKSFIDYLNCGNISKNSTWIDYTCVRYDDLVLKIIPFFDKYKIVGVKLQDYLDFKKVADLMKTKYHLTTLGLEQIKEIKEGMNKGR